MNMSDIETYRQMYHTPNVEMRLAVRKAFCHRFRTEPYLDAGWDAVALTRLDQHDHFVAKTNQRPVTVLLAEGGTIHFGSMMDCAEFYNVSPATISRWAKIGRPCKGCRDIIKLKEE